MLALIIVLFFEGAMIGIAPEAWKRTMRQLIELPSSALRRTGLSMAFVALLLLIFALSTGH